MIEQRADFPWSPNRARRFKRITDKLLALGDWQEMYSCEENVRFAGQSLAHHLREPLHVPSPAVLVDDEISASLEPSSRRPLRNAGMSGGPLHRDSLGCDERPSLLPSSSELHFAESHPTQG